MANAVAFFAKKGRFLFKYLHGRELVTELITELNYRAAECSRTLSGDAEMQSKQIRILFYSGIKLALCQLYRSSLRVECAHETGSNAGLGSSLCSHRADPIGQKMHHRIKTLSRNTVN